MFVLNQSAKLATIVALGAYLGSAAAAVATVFAPPIGVDASSQDSLLQEAKVNITIGIGQGYDRLRHGRRCNFRHDNCRNYYGGYYYQNPWWLMPGMGGTHIMQYDMGAHRYSVNHVRWCADHFRSYNSRTNTWLSYSGQYRQCRSPY